MNKFEWAYFAGLFDGEGSVSLWFGQRRTKTKSCVKYAWVSNASLRIANNDPIALLELEKKFGGCVRKHKNKDSYSWTVQGYGAVEFAEKLIVYSRMKTMQLEIFLEFMYSKLGRGKVLNQKIINHRLKLIEELRQEKRKFNKNPGHNQYTALRRINKDQFGPKTGF